MGLTKVLESPFPPSCYTVQSAEYMSWEEIGAQVLPTHQCHLLSLCMCLTVDLEILYRYKVVCVCLGSYMSRYSEVSLQFTTVLVQIKPLKWLRRTKSEQIYQTQSTWTNILFFLFKNPPTVKRKPKRNRITSDTIFVRHGKLSKETCWKLIANLSRSTSRKPPWPSGAVGEMRRPQPLPPFMKVHQVTAGRTDPELGLSEESCDWCRVMGGRYV